MEESASQASGIARDVRRVMCCFSLLSSVPQPMLLPSDSIFSTHTMLCIPPPPSSISSSIPDDDTRLNMCCWGATSVSFLINGKSTLIPSSNLQPDNSITQTTQLKTRS